MKKKLFVLLGLAALLFTSCSSSNKESDVNSLYNGKDTSAYSIDSKNYVAKEDLTSADVWVTSQDLSAATVAEYEAVCNTVFASIRGQTALAADAYSNTTSKFSVYNELDKQLAEKYKDEVEYLIENGTATASYEGAHTFNNDDLAKFSNGAYAFSYVAKYNSVGLLTNATLIASFVQKEEAKDATFMRTYKASVSIKWVKA